MSERYPGKAPSNVRTDAKYHIRWEAEIGDWGVQLIYELGDDVRALLTTVEHPELVRKVNAVKEEQNGSPGGAFYINEYGHVIVPTDDAGPCYAGRYDNLLAFDFDGSTISPLPSEDMHPGDIWRGPRPGVGYTLSAGGEDIYYRMEQAIERGRIERKVRLSNEVGLAPARGLAQRLAGCKGHSGGVVYINEARVFFAPVEDQGEWIDVYLGQLEAGDPWFTEPLLPSS